MIVIPAPGTDKAAPSAPLLAMLLADARLPVGGHTVSNGLEPALARDDLSAAGIPDYLRTRLRTVARVEAATAVVARSMVAEGRSAQLAEVEEAWAARTPSQEMRATSATLGRGLLRLVGRLWSLPTLPERCSHGVVLGATAAVAGLPADTLARLVGYDDVQTVAAAALKLLPLDPADPVAWVHDVLPDIDRLAAEVAGLTEPGDIPASGAPQIEAWAQAHAHTTRRLFRA